ncbi:MAG: hypothetical protein ABJA64_01720 [Candidatus Saccharibacteria bacterium]
MQPDQAVAPATPGEADPTAPTPDPTETTNAPTVPDSTETTPTTPPPETVTVTTNEKLIVRTANVTGRHMDGYKPHGYDKRPYYGTWAERRVALIKDITRTKVDVMGLQEVDAGTQSDYVRSNLNKHNYVTMDKWTRNINPIYWDKNKFEAVRGSTFDQNDRDGHRGTWVILNDKATNEDLIFINAHYEADLTSKGNTDRIHAAKSVAKLADDLSNGGEVPVFFTGDVNSDIGNDPYAILRASKADNGASLVEAHTQTANRVNDKYNTANMYASYTKNGRTKYQKDHEIIDQGWYYKTIKQDDGTTLNIRTDKTYNDLPTLVHTKKHGALRSSDHNAQTFYYNIETKKAL